MNNTVTKLYAVGIIEDNDSLRANIELYLSTTRDYFVGFSGSCIKSILSDNTDCDPDYILLDIHLKDTDTIDCIGELKTRFPKAAIIIMTGDKNDKFILKAFENGAKGYLYKPFALADTVSTMKSLEENGSYMSADTATKLISLITKKDNTDTLKHTFQLTERENEIVNLVREGLGYQAIADRLFISYHTVNHHMKNIYSKMNVSSRSELIATYLMNNN